MADLDEAFSSLVVAESRHTPTSVELQARVARRRRRRWAGRGAALLAVVGVIAAVATLGGGQRRSVDIRNSSTTTVPHQVDTQVTRIGWRVTSPPGWHVTQSAAVCNPGEPGLVVSRDPKAFSAAENEVGCFIGQTTPAPAGEVVVSLSVSEVPTSRSTPPTPLPISLADVPADPTAPALRSISIIEGDKEYLVRVEGSLAPNGLKLLNHGLELDGEKLKPARVSWQNEHQLRFVLRQGKKRQIRRMCEMVGLTVTGLKRVRTGSVVLGKLPVGKWRYLRADEKF